MLYGIILTAVLVFIDRLSKIWAAEYLIGKGTITVIPGILGLTYAENTGAAFSMLSGKTIVLIGITFFALCFLAYLIFIKKYGTKFEKFFLLLIFAGGIGNLIDRVFVGYVVDYFNFLFMNFAIFNVADICVTVAFVLFLIYGIFIDPKIEKSRQEENSNV